MPDNELTGYHLADHELADHRLADTQLAGNGLADKNPTNDNQLTILLVDDDAVDVMNVRRAFAKNNLTNAIFEARNGVEALQVLRSGSLPARHIVLLDLNMPMMNGIEFLRELRADPTLKTTSVVVLTTSNEERDRVEAYQLHVAGYLLKPVTFSSFIDLMAALNKYWTLVELP